MKQFAIFGVLALLLIAACQPIVVKDGQTPEKTISVSSTAEIETAANQVEIYLGIETTAPDAKQSQERNSVIANKIIDGIVNIGIDKSDISTANFNVYEDREWDQQTQRSVLKGYKTTNSVVVKTTKLDLAGAILDAAAKAGANQVNSVQFTLTNAKTEEVKAEALKQATASSKSKAQAIADGLGVKLGSLASVSEANVYVPMMYARGYESAVAMKADMGAPQPPILPGKTTVTATVSVAYNIG